MEGSNFTESLKQRGVCFCLCVSEEKLTCETEKDFK